MQIESLTIALFYEHPEAGTWSLLDLVKHRGVIDPDDLDSKAFFKASGAIRMYCYRFKCFLQTGAAGDLRSYVNFLIESLVSLGDSNISSFFTGVSIGTPFFDYKDVIAGLLQENQTMIVLQNDNDALLLSYLDPDQCAPEHRLSPYFRNVRIDKKSWRMAAIEALDEYFCVAEEQLQYGNYIELQNLVFSWRTFRKISSL